MFNIQLEVSQVELIESAQREVTVSYYILAKVVVL